MKTTILTSVLASVALFAFSGSAPAQYKPTGNDGITASPKLRERLDEYNRNHSPAVKPAEVQKMACPMCKDKVTTRIDYTARGANKPTVTVATHLCKGCGTDVKTVGHGKMKTEIATHKCTDCGAENLACCNTGKDSKVATKGMEKKGEKNLNFEVAPIK